MSLESALLTLGLWTFFGTQHSFLAQPPIKNFLRRRIGDDFVDYCYRFIYFASQCVVYPAFWFVITRLESGPVLFAIPAALFPVLFALKLFSYLLILLSLLAADINDFIGTKPLYLYLRSKVPGSEPLGDVKVFGQSKLVVRFPFNIVRNPMYLGLLISMASSTHLITEKALLNFACLFAYVLIGVYFEERQLIKIFGGDYLEYQKSVSKLLPTSVFKLPA